MTCRRSIPEKPDFVLGKACNLIQGNAVAVGRYVLGYPDELVPAAALFLFAIRPRLCAGLAAAARIDHSEKHPLTDPKQPPPRAFRGHRREGISYPSHGSANGCRGAP